MSSGVITMFFSSSIGISSIGLSSGEISNDDLSTDGSAVSKPISIFKWYS